MVYERNSRTNSSSSGHGGGAASSSSHRPQSSGKQQRRKGGTMQEWADGIAQDVDDNPLAGVAGIPLWFMVQGAAIVSHVARNGLSSSDSRGPRGHG